MRRTPSRASLPRAALAVAAGLLALVVVPTARAHFLWLTAERGAGETVVLAFLAEPPVPDLPMFMKTIEGATYQADGKALVPERGQETFLIRLPEDVRTRQVLRGGPVQRGRGFVLHSPDYFRQDNSYTVSEDVCLTATLDVLKAMAFKNSPSDALFALGYCGWSPGQLEDEIRRVLDA